MHVPVATYRVQINPDFGFVRAAGIVDYLFSLGVSHLYAGPVFKARPGSKHGYDIVDPNKLNPELGSEQEFHDLISRLAARGMGWIQDIVPNHMAIDGGNAMLMDILENFEESGFFNYFDIDWDYHPETEEPRLTLPFLARPCAECVAEKELHLVMDGSGIAVVYRDMRFPLRLSTYYDVLTAAAPEPETAPPGVIRLMDLFTEAADSHDHGLKAGLAKTEMLRLYQSDTAVREYIDGAIGTINASSGDVAGDGALGRLLEKQVFRLMDWKTGSAEINYRRFFNINRLIALRMEIPDVFEHHHRLVKKWFADVTIAGVRVDHVDGLYDALGYLSRLRSIGPEGYIAVEKILTSDETLSTHWEVQGTTGYDFLNHLNGIFCAQSNSASFEAIYRDFTGFTETYNDIVYRNRRMIVETHFQAALERLTRSVEALLEDMGGPAATGHEELKRALVGLVACFPVYRTYIGPQAPHPADRERVKKAIQEAVRRDPEVARDLDVLEHIILAATGELDDSDLARSRLRFVRALQQYTGPVMAKGFEDTVLYVYDRLISLNEVGGDPETFGIGVEHFHDFNRRRLAGWPHTMNATSTHDTKRGEDVRARINVLSEIPQEYGERIWKWRDLNSTHATVLDDVRVPSYNDEYFLYQTLIGAYPFEDDDRAGFFARLEAYMVKAMREGKSLTSWAEPDVPYEKGFIAFIKAILDPAMSPAFLEDFTEFAAKVHRYGIYNSLSQTLLKIASPGVPDFYQGAELWDLNLVDPDNRRPVDFAKRRRMLEGLDAKIKRDLPGLLRRLLSHPQDGAVKLFVILSAMRARCENARLFAEGEYIPVVAEGAFAGHVVSFVRKAEGRAALAVAPRFLTSVVEPNLLPLGGEVWKDTRLLLPDGLPSRWKNMLTGREMPLDGRPALGDILSRFPIALLFSMDHS